MDRIQRWLKASLEADPASTARQAWFDNLPTEPDALSFWFSVAIKQSETEPWWYDTLIALVQQHRQSPEWKQSPELPSLLLNWCLSVAVGDIAPPKRLGRPANPMRDMLICTAVDAYTDPQRGDQSCSSYRISHRPTFRETVQWLLLLNCACCRSDEIDAWIEARSAERGQSSAV